MKSKDYLFNIKFVIESFLELIKIFKGDKGNINII